MNFQPIFWAGAVIGAVAVAMIFAAFLVAIGGICA